MSRMDEERLEKMAGPAVYLLEEPVPQVVLEMADEIRAAWASEAEKDARIVELERQLAGSQEAKMNRIVYIGLEFKKEDMWVGIFWRNGLRKYDLLRCVEIFICIIPMFPIHIIVRK